MNAYIEIYAVVLGVDETILNIKLKNGFSMKKMKLREFLFKDQIIRADGYLNARYYASNLSVMKQKLNTYFYTRKRNWSW